VEIRSQVGVAHSDEHNVLKSLALRGDHYFCGTCHIWANLLGQIQPPQIRGR
jgi:hypothetical protein